MRTESNIDSINGTAHTFSCCEFSFFFCVKFLQFVLSQYVKDRYQNLIVPLFYYIIHGHVVGTRRKRKEYLVSLTSSTNLFCHSDSRKEVLIKRPSFRILQKGGVPAAPSGTATLLRLSPNHQFHLRPPLAVTDFRCPRLSWLDGRCVQGPGTYSPRHG